MIYTQQRHLSWHPWRRAVALLLAALGVSAWAGPGTLNISTQPGDAQIFINGERRGSSPGAPGQNLSLQLPPGQYLVEAMKPGAGGEQYGRRMVFVSDDKTRAMTLNLSGRNTAQAREEIKRKFAGQRPQITMVAIPAGAYDMGSSVLAEESPVHRVNVPVFEMSRTEVTFDQWDACVANGGCDHIPDDNGWGRGTRPVIDVSWHDAQQFVVWLNRTSGQRYRLPTEAEWEYAARAGNRQAFSNGNCLPVSHANFDASERYADCATGVRRKQTLPVATLAPNGFGLHDMHGNVAEWTQDCWNRSYTGAAPTDGAAWNTGECVRRVRRGGSWDGQAEHARSAYRCSGHAMERSAYVGFRLVRHAAAKVSQAAPLLDPRSQDIQRMAEAAPAAPSASRCG